MPTALVTGATAGLGAEFARQLAASGHDLVLVARDAERLSSVQQELAAQWGVHVEVIGADLTSDTDCAAVVGRIADPNRPLDVLVNNAGSGMYTPFGTRPIEDEEYQLDLNVRAVLRLTHAAVRSMTERNSGGIVNVSSVAIFVPRGSSATYSASKAYVSQFSEALAVHLHTSPVSVTAVHPGFTRTEFHQRAHKDMSRVPERMWLTPEEVVREGLADAMKGKPLSVPTRQYRTRLRMLRLVPRPVLRRVLGRRAR